MRHKRESKISFFVFFSEISNLLNFAYKVWSNKVAHSTQRKAFNDFLCDTNGAFFLITKETLADIVRFSTDCDNCTWIEHKKK